MVKDLRKKIDALNPWFYEIKLGEEIVTPGLYHDDSPDNRCPDKLVYRQQCRRTLLVDAIAERYDFKDKNLLDVACNCGFWSSIYINEYKAKSLMGRLRYSVEKIEPKFKIGKGLKKDDNYHDERRICLFCRK